MVKIDNRGFKRLQRNLQQTSQEFSSGGSVSLDELFSPSFMKTHTPYASISDFLAAGGFGVTSQIEFDAIPVHELDEHVKKETKFNSWEAMLQEAGRELIQSRLFR